MVTRREPHRFNPNSNEDGLLSSSTRACIETHLRTTLRNMTIAYILFTVGFGLLLFKALPGMILMGAAMLGMSLYGWIRNHRIRKLGFSRQRPYPAEWSEDFNEAETELFKKFTVTWTLLLTLWTSIKFLPWS